ncbi:cupin-like domain-containing protein [Vibrio sp. TRT 1302]|uniref:cupin-like domain-containing protein n=1 Tax=Vibrio sp. TRT 1302 TaxID=3418504 RepID=UPI003CFA18E6
MIPLMNVLRQGFENPEGLPMSCQFLFEQQDKQATGFYIQCDSKGEQIKEGVISNPKCTIRLPLNLAQQIERDITTIDYRDPEIIGQIKFEGDEHIANHMAKAMLQPNEWIQSRFKEAEEQHAEMNAESISNFARLSNPTEIELLEELAKNRPFIVTGMELPRDHTYWTLDTLDEHFGDETVRVRSAEDKETMRQFTQRMREFEVSYDKNFVEGFTKPYTEGASLPEAMKPWFMPLYFTAEDFSDPQIWLGCVPTHIPASSLHRDPMCGFLYQIIGRKKLLVYSADQAPYLYPMKAYNSNYQPCWVKPENPNFDVFPQFKNAKVVEVILHPGEMLVQPKGWFHSVYALDSPTFSVSYFWRY